MKVFLYLGMRIFAWYSHITVSHSMLILINSARMESKHLDSFLLQDEFPPPQPHSGAFSERLVVTLSSLFINSYNIAFILMGTTSSDNPKVRMWKHFLGYLFHRIVLEKLLYNVWEMSNKFNKTVTHFWFYEHIWSHNAIHPHHLSCWVLHMDQYVLISDVRSGCVLMSWGSWIEYKSLVLTCREQ